MFIGCAAKLQFCPSGPIAALAANSQEPNWLERGVVLTARLKLSVGQAAQSFSFSFISTPPLATETSTPRLVEMSRMRTPF